MDILNQIINFLGSEFSYLGYFVLMIVAALEATPMFGFFVPGQVVAVGAGILVKIGSFQLIDVLVVLSIGAVLGDLVGYYIGDKYGESFILKYGKYFYLKKESFEKTKDLIKEHAGKTIIIGRFNSITRAITPFTAGATCVPFYKFLFFDIIGGISWAVFFVMLGYLFGHNYKVITGYFGEFFVIAFLIGALIVYAYKRINRKRHIFHRRHLKFLLLNLFSLYTFAKMLENFVDQDVVIDFDRWINTQIALWRTPLLDQIMTFVTHLGGTNTILSGGLLALGFFIYNKKWRYSLILIFAMILGKLSEVATKYIIGRDRPDNSIIEANGFSFPSGHSTMAMIFFAILIYYFKNHIKNESLKYWLITLCLLIILGVGFSRIYLGVHWFSDVVAGFSLGLFNLTLMVLVLEFITTVFKEKVGKIKKYLNK